MPPGNEGFSRQELGERLKVFIRRATKTQAQVADEVEMDRTYLSQMVNGKVNWVNSSYFPALVTTLGIKEHEVRELNPAAVITVAAPDPDPTPAPQRMLPPGLLDAVEEYGDTHPALRKPRVQEQLALVRHWDGGPKTARDWLDFYLDNRRRFTEE